MHRRNPERGEAGLRRPAEKRQRHTERTRFVPPPVLNGHAAGAGTGWASPVGRRALGCDKRAELRERRPPPGLQHPQLVRRRRELGQRPEPAPSTRVRVSGALPAHAFAWQGALGRGGARAGRVRGGDAGTQGRGGADLLRSVRSAPRPSCPTCPVTCPISTEEWTRRVHFVREGRGGGATQSWCSAAATTGKPATSPSASLTVSASLPGNNTHFTCPPRDRHVTATSPPRDRHVTVT